MSRRLLALLLGSSLALLVPATPALAASEPQADNLKRVHQLSLAAQQSLSDFFMYSDMESDPRYAALIEKALGEANADLLGLGPMPGDASRALLQRLEQQWQDYQRNLQALSEELKRNGYTELQPVADMARSNRQLIQLSNELYQKIEQESAIQVPQPAQQARALSQQMQAIAIEYASRNAWNRASFTSGEEVKPLDVLASDFAAGLNKLSQQPQNSAQAQQILQRITVKWRFIEKSLKNYDQDSVPFVVHKYAEIIVTSLEELAELYSPSKA